MNGDHICSIFVPNHYYVCIQTIFPQNFNITTGSPKPKRYHGSIPSNLHKLYTQAQMPGCWEDKQYFTW